jgi:rhamnulokinase
MTSPDLPSPPTDLRALVAIDLGAESCRVSLLRWLSGAPSITLVHRFSNAPVERDGELHWDMTRILGELHTGLRLCAELAAEGIRSIAVDGWAVDYVRLDPDGIAPEGLEPDQPFCYRDTRTLAAEEAAHQRIPAARMRELTGVQLSRINTAYQLFAEQPHLADKPWLNLPEYVLHRLGAAPVAEITNASHSQLLGLDGTWSEEIFSALNLTLTHAPRLVPAGTDIGQLQGPLASLAAFSNTRLIAPCCHDTASAIAGIADSGPNWAYISSGTWSLVGTLLDAPCNTPEAREANFTNLAAAGGKTCFHKNVNGLWLLKQCMDAWAADGASFTVPELIAAAESIPDPGYTFDVDDPDLLLPGDMPGRINAQLTRRGLPALDTSPAHAPALASLIFHSLAARYAEVLALIERLSGKRFTHLHIVGGGSQNQLLNRLTEQATGLAVKGTCAESSTIGNFAVQLAALEGGDGSLAVRTSAWAGRLHAASHA